MSEILMEAKEELENSSPDNVVKRKHDTTQIEKAEKSSVSVKKKRRSQYNPKEEARLERIVFGDPSDIINNLPDDDTCPTAEKKGDIDASVSVIDHKDDDDDTSSNSDASTSEEPDTVPHEKVAWVDEDDAKYSVKDAFAAQHRKLKRYQPEKLYTELLHKKYKQLVGTPKWAELNRTATDQDDLDEDILKHSCHIEQSKSTKLPKNIIEIKALTAINKETHDEGPIISSVEFHPSSTVALVAGTSGILSIFQVDGIKNPKLHSIEYKKFPISSARFLKEGMEILCGSQYYPHCHSYNLISGKTFKTPLPHGITNMERFEISPNGKFIAICGRMGEIYLLESSSKELIGTLKMNARCRALAFTPDGSKLISHGESNEMYIWDMNSRTCVHRANDDGCISCKSIAISSSGQFMATGSKEGVVNLYDMKNILNHVNPTPLKVVLNLVTSITALKFNPSSEILAMASNKKSNAFKMLHLPSFTVFSNFPTFETNMVMPKDVSFSPGSGFLSISNRSGTAFLYRLKHYKNY